MKETQISNFIEEKLAGNREPKNLHAEIEKIPSNIDVAGELKQEKEKNNKLTDDLKKSVALIKEITQMNLSKDLQIERLSKQLNSVSLNSKSFNPNESLFSAFSGIFAKDQLKELRSISSGKRRDSTFVLRCMRFMYPDANALNNISVTGKKFKGLVKNKMSEDNVKIITKMLNERLVSEESDEVFILQRLSNVKKLIRDAITKLKKPINEPTPSLLPLDGQQIFTPAKPQQEVYQPMLPYMSPYAPINKCSCQQCRAYSGL